VYAILADSLVIARFSFVRAFREKILYLTLLALALILPLVGGIDVEGVSTRVKLATDISLFLLDISVWVLCTASVHALISTDVSRGGFALILARGIHPFSLVLGRWIAIAFFVALNVTLIATVVCSVVATGSSSVTVSMAWGALESIMKGCLFVSLLIFLGVTFSPVTGIVLGTLGWIAGHSLQIISNLIFEAGGWLARFLGPVIRAFPDFNLLELPQLGGEMSAGSWLLIVVRFFGYSLGFLALASQALERHQE